MSTKEVGKDEDTAQSLQRKLEVLTSEVQSFQPSIENIKKAADSLIEREHFDSENITQKKVRFLTLRVDFFVGKNTAEDKIPNK